MMDSEMTVKEVFAYFDTRGDERIAVSQVGDALRALGQNPTENEVAKYTETWKDRDYRITLEEFLPIYQSIDKAKTTHSVDEFVEGLSHFDKNGIGSIDVYELRHLLTTLGERMTDEEVDVLLTGQEDSHGKVNIAKFVRAVMQG